MGGLGYPFATLGRAVTAFPDDVRGFLVGMLGPVQHAGLRSSLGLVSATSAWLAFLPPASYLRRVRARSRRSRRDAPQRLMNLGNR
jgi:hypothetical protein